MAEGPGLSSFPAHQPAMPVPRPLLARARPPGGRVAVGPESLGFKFKLLPVSTGKWRLPVDIGTGDLGPTSGPFKLKQTVDAGQPEVPVGSPSLTFQFTGGFSFTHVPGHCKIPGNERASG